MIKKYSELKEKLGLLLTDLHETTLKQSELAKIISQSELYDLQLLDIVMVMNKNKCEVYYNIFTLFSSKGDYIALKFLDFVELLEREMNNCKTSLEEVKDQCDELSWKYRKTKF